MKMFTINNASYGLNGTQGQVPSNKEKTMSKSSSSSFFDARTGKMNLTEAENFRRIMHEKYQDTPYAEREMMPHYSEELDIYLTLHLLHPDYSCNCGTVVELFENFQAHIACWYEQKPKYMSREIVVIFYAEGPLGTTKGTSVLYFFPDYCASAHPLQDVFSELELIAILEESERVGYILFGEQSQQFLGPEIDIDPDEIGRIVRTSRFADSNHGAR